MYYKPRQKPPRIMEYVFIISLEKTPKVIIFDYFYLLKLNLKTAMPLSVRFWKIH